MRNFFGISLISVALVVPFAANATITSKGYVDRIVGVLADLNTSEKTSLVAAVNSVNTDLRSHATNTEIHVTAAEKAAWDAKMGNLNDAQQAALDSGITSAKVAQYDAYATNIEQIQSNTFNIASNTVAIQSVRDSMGALAHLVIPDTCEAKGTCVLVYKGKDVGFVLEDVERASEDETTGQTDVLEVLTEVVPTPAG